MNRRRFNQLIFATASGLAALAMLVSLALASTRIDIPGPPGSEAFGTSVTMLPNGNLVVSDPGYDAEGVVDAGAVYLYNGATGELISMLTGSHSGDQVGWTGVYILDDGNFVIDSPFWNNEAGAITWGSSTTGVSGTVSAVNSLVGGTPYDRVGYPGILLLANGSYIVLSPGWDNGEAIDAGAMTFVRAGASVTGTVSAANSLVGSTAGDRVGAGAGLYFPNGHYLVGSPLWDNGAAVDAGAVAWVDTGIGISGPISAVNSLVGSSTGDQVASTTWLPDGNYLVVSPKWDNGPVVDAGAVTWADGTKGATGTISSANSLVGSSTGDKIGEYGIFTLTNGNYLVRSPSWDNGSLVDAGAVTWGSGTAGTAGAVSAANSLVGSAAGDQVGSWALTELANGNYLWANPSWDNGSLIDVGAVTWGSGSKEVTGAISSANSLVGSVSGDRVGQYILDLRNGNYLVKSPYWDNGPAADAGAITWGSGTSGVVGTVSAANSLVGSQMGDRIGILAGELADGNYLVTSPDWDNGPTADVGAITWGSGTTGVVGPISASNSLVGTTAGDQIGSGGVRELPTGNYLVLSPNWDNGTVVDAGAVTWLDRTSGVTGLVSSANSLIGGSAGDQVGLDDILTLSNGNYLVHTPDWDNGPVVDAGAVTWGSGAAGIIGLISPANSLVGSAADDRVGSNGVQELAGGNYLVTSPDWDNGMVADIGAVTWGDSETGVSGPVSSANSLVGSQPGDRVGYSAGISLANGNYIVASPFWDNGTIVDAGAITWCSGSAGITGPVSPANSLVGSTAEDSIGYDFKGDYLYITSLSNGNYVVASPYWDNGAIVDAGAVTWGDGTTGISGPVSPDNSLVGSSDNDLVGINPALELSNGDYVVDSSHWDNGAEVDAGAVTWGRGIAGLRGPITDQNSILGTTNYFYSVPYFYDPVNDQLVFSFTRQNKVSLFRLNRSPVADAGLPQNVERGALVRLVGSASYDPDGNLPLVLTWTQISGPSVSLSDPHAVSPTFTAPDERTSLTFNLVVTDALGLSSKPARAIVFVDPYQYFWPLLPEH